MAGGTPAVPGGGERGGMERAEVRMMIEEALAQRGLPNEAWQGVNARAAGRAPSGLEDGGREVPGPWRMRLAGDGTATFSGCYYKRLMMTLQCSNVDGSGKLTGSVSHSGTVYVGVSITDADGAGTIVTGATLADVSHDEIPEDQSAERIPLYKVVNGRVVFRYNWMPVLGMTA